jgi:formylglycine-generating enzyme required for sulfatase activity
MPKIFICYRRHDAEFQAHWICRKLQEQFGHEQVFIDVETIPLGVDFRTYLNDAIAQCGVLLAVIGDRWLDCRAEGGQRRLDDPDDFVRIEIQAALMRGIPVVPVLLGQVPMPRKQDLPAALSGLAYRNAVQVRSGRDFDGDIDRLMSGLSRLLATPPKATGLSGAADAGLADGPATAAVPGPVPTTHGTIEPSVELCEPLSSAGWTTLRDKILTNSIGMKFRWIPAGEFLMGSPDVDEAARSEEKPQHRVLIAQPFYLGIYEVTQAEYESVTGTNPSHFKESGPTAPVERVSWEDAQEFCRRLSGRAEERGAGRHYRLPTEAEWEYACRAGTATRYGFDESMESLGDYAWYHDNAERKTHPVGQKKANAWGLYDMQGNVWEWCADWYDSGYYGRFAGKLAVDPVGPPSASDRVDRGGCWFYFAGGCRAAYRGGDAPAIRTGNLGFRVALVRST